MMCALNPLEFYVPLPCLFTAHYNIFVDTTRLLAPLDFLGSGLVKEA